MLIVCDNAKESCPIFPGPGSRINAEEVNKRRLAEKKRFERKFEALVGALNDFTSAYNAGRGQVWPSKEAEAVAKAMREFEKDFPSSAALNQLFEPALLSCHYRS